MCWQNVCKLGASTFVSVSIASMRSQFALNVYPVPSIHNKAPIIGAATDDGLLAVDRSKATLKWAILWRSIILSCFDGNKTFVNYAESVRKLDFEELALLLDSQPFRSLASRYETLFTIIGMLLILQISHFFDGELQQFKVERLVKGAKSKSTSVSLDVASTVNAIADCMLHCLPHMITLII